MTTKRWLVLLCVLVLLIMTACQTEEPEPMVDAPESPTEVSAEIPTEIPAEMPEEGAPVAEEEAPAAEEPAEPVEEVEPGPEEVASGPLLDAEAMIDRLGNYVLRPSDLPHAYSISEDGELHETTLRLINEMGEIEAKTYVKETGRVDGWWLRLKRTNKGDFAPNAFESSIELFSSPEGARKAMGPDYNKMYQDESRELLPVEGGCDLGDACEFYYSEKEDPETEIIAAQYNLAFTYKNAFVWVMARGLKVDMERDYVLEAARNVLAKLEAAPTQ